MINHRSGGDNEIKAWAIHMAPIPYGITWRLMLLKVLPQSPRPIGGLHAQIMRNHQRMESNEINARGILLGPIPYGIIWRFVLLKILPQPPRPIGGLHAQIRGNHQRGGIMK